VPAAAYPPTGLTGDSGLSGMAGLGGAYNPAAEASCLLQLDRRTGKYQTAGGTPATATSDPVGDWRGGVNGAAQTWGPYRPTVAATGGVQTDGVSTTQLLLDTAVTLPDADWTLYLAGHYASGTLFTPLGGAGDGEIIALGPTGVLEFFTPYLTLSPHSTPAGAFLGRLRRRSGHLYWAVTGVAERDIGAVSGTATFSRVFDRLFGDYEMAAANDLTQLAVFGPAFAGGAKVEAWLLAAEGVAL
jgi:hypothetical protein